MYENGVQGEQQVRQAYESPAFDTTEVREDAEPLTAKDKIAATVYDAVSIFSSAIVTIMVIFTFIFRFVGVIGPSMEPTLLKTTGLP